MTTNKKSGKAVKIIIAILLLAGIAAAAYYFLGTKADEEVVVETDEVVNVESDDAVVERLTKAELEESINNTSDGFVPEEIISRFSPNEQKVIVKNDPEANIASGISEVWLLMYMGMYSKITVVEEECVFDACNRLETLVIIAE